MSLPAIFSLIFATLLGLLPIFLLVGRRAIASRLNRRRDGGKNDSPAESGTPTPGAGRTPQGRPGVDPTAADQPPPRLAISGTGDPAGESAILDRLIRERRAAAESNREIARVRHGIGRLDTSPIGSETTASAGTAHSGNRADRTRSEGARIEARLARLSILQRGVVYREILGPPVGSRAPGEHERY